MNTPDRWDIGALRLQGDLLPYLQTARARAVAACQLRRQRVLAHPDLAGRLAELLQLARPEQWNGYIAPEHDATGLPNQSPIRAGLVEIVTEAELRKAS